RDQHDPVLEAGVARIETHTGLPRRSASPLATVGLRHVVVGSKLRRRPRHCQVKLRAGPQTLPNHAYTASGLRDHGILLRGMRSSIGMVLTRPTGQADPRPAGRLTKLSSDRHRPLGMTPPAAACGTAPRMTRRTRRRHRGAGNNPAIERSIMGDAKMKLACMRMIPVSALALLASTALVSAASMDDLVKAAKAEGQLTIIAVPHDWCGYGAVIESFKAKYGLTVNELNPDAGSGDEIEAIKANKDNKGPQAPDVIDVGLSFGPSSKKDGLLQPYKVSTWDSIPDDQKDAEGYWYGDYYGVLAFEINAD